MKRSNNPLLYTLYQFEPYIANIFVKGTNNYKIISFQELVNMLSERSFYAYIYFKDWLLYGIGDNKRNTRFVYKFKNVNNMQNLNPLYKPYLYFTRINKIIIFFGNEIHISKGLSGTYINGYLFDYKYKTFLTINNKLSKEDLQKYKTYKLLEEL